MLIVRVIPIMSFSINLTRIFCFGISSYFDFGVKRSCKKVVALKFDIGITPPDRCSGTIGGWDA